MVGFCGAVFGGCPGGSWGGPPPGDPPGSRCDFAINASLEACKACEVSGRLGDDSSALVRSVEWTREENGPADAMALAASLQIQACSCGYRMIVLSTGRFACISMDFGIFGSIGGSELA